MVEELRIDKLIQLDDDTYDSIKEAGRKALIDKYGDLLTEVKCTNCEYQGTELDLPIVNFDEYTRGCPNCDTDAYLKDVKQLNLSYEIVLKITINN